MSGLGSELPPDQPHGGEGGEDEEHPFEGFLRQALEDLPAHENAENNGGKEDKVGH